MRTLLLLAATRLAVASVTICLGFGWAAAQPAPADPHAHPDGPHQIPPLLPGETYGVTVNPLPPTVPLNPPPPVVLPPPIVVPMRPPTPPLPPNVAVDAAGAAVTTANGLRVTFGSLSADLSPTTVAALQTIATSVPPPGEGVFSVTAYAAGTPDDPSTARRLALSRALAVRSVLITAGVPSARIYVRALGASVPTPPDTSPDRVDIVVTVNPPAAAAPAATSAAPPSGQSAPPPEKAAP